MNSSDAHTYDTLSCRLQPYGQDHLLRFWSELSDGEQTRLAKQLEQIDLEQMKRLVNECSGSLKLVG